MHIKNVNTILDYSYLNCIDVSVFIDMQKNSICNTFIKYLLNQKDTPTLREYLSK